MSLTTEQDPEKPNLTFIEVGNQAAAWLAQRTGGYAQSMLLEAWANIPTTAHILGGAVVGRDAQPASSTAGAGCMAMRIPSSVTGRPYPPTPASLSLTITAMTEHAMSHVPPLRRQTTRRHSRRRPGESIRRAILTMKIRPSFPAFSLAAIRCAPAAPVPDPVRSAATSTPRASCRSVHGRAAKGLRATLPFEDKRDFEEAQRGFVAALYRQIMAEAGNVAWDIGSYDFLLQGKDFDSIHPSLQRQAVLNMAYGLYEVVPGRIYQVRGFDLANISFIRGDTGWIVFDPLTAKETAPRRRLNSSMRSSASARSWPSSTPIPTSITSAACAAWSMRRT